MSENEKNVDNASNEAAKKPINKKIVIIISAAVVALLVALIPIIIMLTNPDKPNNGNDTPDTGETFEGVYTLDMTGSGAPIISTYDFKEDGKVTASYNTGEGNVVTEYTYKIAIENGEKVIKLTAVEGGDVRTEPFVSGTITTNYDVCRSSCGYDQKTN